MAAPLYRWTQRGNRAIDRIGRSTGFIIGLAREIDGFAAGDAPPGRRADVS
jgi:hypothetical protein